MNKALFQAILIWLIQNDQAFEITRLESYNAIEFNHPTRNIRWRFYSIGDELYLDESNITEPTHITKFSQFTKTISDHAGNS